jgi:5-formyltetrahydrofolate cyclo-ligase
MPAKEDLRERVWDELEERGAARFPFPPHGRIPNFAGAKETAERLTEQEVWQEAGTVKANPDAPQLPVRRAALRAGKTLYMAVPRLRDPECFLELDPAEIEDVDHATTVGGSAEVGVPVPPEEVAPVDLVVSGSVAVTPEGDRVGKGEGYSDLEFAVLREFDLVDDDTATATTVHELQVVEEGVGTAAHDVPMDIVVTPGRVVREKRRPKPEGIQWEMVADRLDEIPVLQRLAEEDGT